MKKGLRIASLLAGLAMVVGACTGGTSATEAPSVSAEPAASAESMAPASGEPASAPLEGNLEHLAHLCFGRRHREDHLRRDHRGHHGQEPRPDDHDDRPELLQPEQHLRQVRARGPRPAAGPTCSSSRTTASAPRFAKACSSRSTTIVPADQLAQFHELAVEGCKVDGKLYCVPESLKAVGLYYDKTAIPTPADDDG